MDRRLDHERDTILELTESAPGMWCFPTDLKNCCIYRVPHRLHRVNPEAYTPQLVLIGPLNHSLKSQALESRRDTTKTKFMGYLNMEEHKKNYLAEFEKNVGGKEMTEGFREIIKEDEGIIRASYSESTSQIKSSVFVEMILQDSVFIIEHIRRIYEYRKALRQGKISGSRPGKTGDITVDDPCLQTTIKEDLMLLENQLPYFILEKLFDPIIPQLCPNQTLRKLILTYFSIEPTITNVDSTFRHFTDLLRIVRVNTVCSEQSSKTILRYLVDLFRCDCVETYRSRESTKPIFKKIINCICRYDRKEKKEHKKLTDMYNAEKLYGAGVEFMAVNKDSSINVSFKNGCLQIPILGVGDDTEIILRNVMALEQCHYPLDAYVCNFVSFLDFLIDTEKDVDLLMEQGILSNWIGEQKSVVELVNKLGLGITEDESIYYEIGENVNAYYESRINRTRAVLCRKYFANLWTGTAAVAATILLLMTLIQTVTSIIQAKQK